MEEGKNYYAERASLTMRLQSRDVCLRIDDLHRNDFRRDGRLEHNQSRHALQPLIVRAGQRCSLQKQQQQVHGQKDVSNIERYLH